MELRQLECFIAVAEELHFRKASKRLGLSSSALSDRINALEIELGVTLFFRTTRQVSLTQAGAELLRDAKKILSDIDKSITGVRLTAELGLKNLRISGVDEAISVLLPQTLAGFRAKYPNVYTQILEISGSDRHSDQLKNHQTDIAFIRAPSSEDYISSELLYHQSVVVITAADHPLAKEPSLSASDLLHEAIVGYPKHARPILHEMLWHGFRELGKQPRIVCEVIDKSTLLQFVLQGLGIALAPEWIQSIAPPGLSFIPYETGQRRISLYVAYRSTGNHPIIEDLVKDVKQVSRQRVQNTANEAQ